MPSISRAAKQARKKVAANVPRDSLAVMLFRAGKGEPATGVVVGEGVVGDGVVVGGAVVAVVNPSGRTKARELWTE